MEAGKLRTYVRIEQSAPVTGALGGRSRPSGNWTTFAACYASVETLSGGEQSLAKGTAATTAHKIQTRWIDGVTPQMRVAVYDEADEYAAMPLEVYAITSAIDSDHRRRTLVISATRVL